VRARRVVYRAGDWGAGELWFEGDRLVWHELPRPGADGDDEHPLAKRLSDFFAGEAVGFDDVELDLEWCTSFQLAVTQALRRVPRGEVVTYGELAALAGYPGAQRAAGSFCAQNRFPVLVPCHRVVAATGIGSYGSHGPDYKRRLLALEHVAL
jgi:methylated-DNA-[protein]-cysteine S-methyltransferase